jgi:hypothetical protein
MFGALFLSVLVFMFPVIIAETFHCSRTFETMKPKTLGRSKWEDASVHDHVDAIFFVVYTPACI